MASSARRSSVPEESSPVSSDTDDLSLNSIHSSFHLTSGDNPGISIISENLDGTNYDNWSIAMNIALDAKNKLVFVDGSLVRPLESHPTFRIWSRCNSMVKSWILNTVSKQIYKSILHFNDASEIWKDLQTRFHITNLPRSYQLSQQIWSLQHGPMDLSTYYTTLKTLWDELDGANCVTTCRTCDCCKATATKADHAKVIKFLAGLNESYAVIRSHIIMKKNVPELAEVYNLLDQDHTRGISFRSTMLLLSTLLRLYLQSMLLRLTTFRGRIDQSAHIADIMVIQQIPAIRFMVIMLALSTR